MILMLVNGKKVKKSTRMRISDDQGYGADEEDEFEDDRVVAYNEFLGTVNIIKNTILQMNDISTVQVQLLVILFFVNND